MAGTLWCGDNLEILKRFIPDESVDLVYLDPPFNSKRTYNLVFKGSRAQEVAFKDYWSWDESAATFDTLVRSTTTPRTVVTLMKALRDLHIDQDADLVAYLTMMTARLLELHRALRDTGALYLHCDPTAGHYLKVVLDAIFGASMFQNEIVWRRFSSKNDPKRYGRIHDVIFFYTKSDAFCWNEQRMPVEEYSIKKNFTSDDDGRPYTLVDLTANKPGGDVGYEWHGVRPYKGRFWAYSKEKMDQMLAEGRIVFRRTGMPRLKRYLDEQPGKPLQDVWLDIKLATSSKERIGYPTQKPVALMERIVASSSNAGDVVLDPFCGCGTTIEACEQHGREWIGIDIAHKAVEIIGKRLARVGIDMPAVRWWPSDAATAKQLAKRNKNQFEHWAIAKLGGRWIGARAPGRRRRGSGDGGIDGEILYRDEAGSTLRALVSVKAGKSLNPGMVRDLRGTVEREGAAIGVLVTMNKPTDGMRREATRANFLRVSDRDGHIPRLQLITVEDLFAGVHVRAPGVNATPADAVAPTLQGETLALPFPAKPPAKAKTRTKGLSKAKSQAKAEPTKKTSQKA